MKNLKEKIIKNKIKYGLVALFLVAVVTSGIFFLTKEKKVELTKNEVVIEYGDTYSPTIKELVKNIKDFDEKELTLTSNIENEKDKEYPAVGTYEAIVTYNKQKVTQKVEVKDTTAPTFNKVEVIEIPQTDTEYDYSTIVTATDLSSINYTYDDKEVKYGTTGEYTVKVTATDKYDNESVLDVKVKIIEVKEDEEVVSETITNDDGSTTVKTTTKPKPSTPSGSTGGNTGSTGSASNNNTSNSGSSSTPSTPVEKEHKKGDCSSNVWSNMWFNTDAEADAGAEAFLFGDENGALGSNAYIGYQVKYGCRKCGIGVIFYKSGGSYY